MNMDFWSSKRWYMSLGHALISLVIFCLTAPLVGTTPVTAFLVGWWWSREKAQYDNKNKVAGVSNAVNWWKGIWPGSWTRESQIDALIPIALTSILFIVFHYIV